MSLACTTLRSFELHDSSVRMSHSHELGLRGRCAQLVRQQFSGSRIAKELGLPERTAERWKQECKADENRSSCKGRTTRKLAARSSLLANAKRVSLSWNTKKYRRMMQHPYCLAHITLEASQFHGKQLDGGVARRACTHTNRSQSPNSQQNTSVNGFNSRSITNGQSFLLGLSQINSKFVVLSNTLSPRAGARKGQMSSRFQRPNFRRLSMCTRQSRSSRLFLSCSSMHQ